VDSALIASMVAFSFVLSVSPGPNNTMLLTLSSHHGVRGSVPYLVGMAMGLTVMVVAVGAGLGAVFVAYPIAYQVLKYVGFGYVLYMASGILRAGSPESGDMDGVPKTAWKAFVFQAVNPKAWIVIAAFTTAYLPLERGVLELGVGASVFVLATMPGALIWVALGRVVSGLLTSQKSRRIFTSVMAAVLVASMVPVLFIS